MTEALLPNQKLSIEPVLNFGDIPKLVVFGPETPIEYLAFTPKPVDTAAVGRRGKERVVRRKNSHREKERERGREWK